MKLVKSKQRGVKFVWCPMSVTVDMRHLWGDSETNIQIAKEGGFLRMDGNTVQWLVQPNSDKTAPVGWRKSEREGEYDKNPIWISPEALEVGGTKKMKTLDGEIEYQVKEPSLVVYNDKGGQPNLEDGWVQPLKDVVKNYEY
jgi:hypothetical protein